MIRDVIERHGPSAQLGSLDDVAAAWAEAGFEAAEVEEWMNAGCSYPAAARDLADAGVTPAEAGDFSSSGESRTSVLGVTPMPLR